jgi:hypothetical protein
MFRAIKEKFTSRPSTLKIPARAKSAICEMIHLSRKYDTRLKKRPKPENWIMRELYRTTEALIYNNVEFYETLLSDAHSSEEAIQRIQYSSKALPGRNFWTIHDYIYERVTTEDPEYLSFTPTLLEDAITTAKGYALRIINDRAQQPRLKPENLGELTSSTTLLNGLDKLISPEEYLDTIRILLRLNTDDELRLYGIPSLPNGFGASGGIALIRNGKVIDHVRQWIS